MRLRHLFLVATVNVLAGVVFIGCARTSQPEETRISVSFEETPSPAPEVRAALEKYVEDKYSWERSRYRIQFQREEDGLELYYIIHLDDIEHPRPGGKSVLFYFDRARLEVVRALHSQ